MFRAHVLIVRRSQLYYTASGIITPIGGRPTEMHGQQNIKICFIMFIKYPVYKAIANYALNFRGIPQSHQAYSFKAPSVKPQEALSQVLYRTNHTVIPSHMVRVSNSVIK